MKRRIPLLLRTLVVALCCIFGSKDTFATHIVGGDLYYTWITGNTYRITVVLYGDCGPSSAAAFASLPTGAPQVCVYNGTTPVTSLTLRVRNPSAGTEITPVCPDSLTKTQCVNTSNAIPGIKKFVYDTTYTLPTTSTQWRFVFNSVYGSSSAGRAGAITNLAAPIPNMQLQATLDNTVYNNTSPNLTVVPTPFFCLNTPMCYTPGAIDGEGDSLRFDLIPAESATSNCTAIGGPAAYSGGFAYGTTPISATAPIVCALGSFNFNAINGQICFNPSALQRAIVVYKVSEYRSGVLVGTMMREMSFIVRNCPVTPPDIDTVGYTGVVVRDGGSDSKNFHVCGDAGAFTLKMEPRPDASVLPPLKVTVTATGIPTGMTFSVVGNGTDTPHVTINGNASLMSPGVYTFFLNLRDNACPLNGNNTIAYTITIYPVPAISHTVVSQADCTHDAVVRITPGGTGKPWTIKVSDPTLLAPADTFETFVDSVAFYDTLAPGPLPGPNIYILTIYTSVSTECALWDTVRLNVPQKLLPVVNGSDPTYCGKNDGFIVVSNLNVGGQDTVTYMKDGVAQTPVIAIVNSAGEIVIPALRAATYSNIVVKYGYCTSDPVGPVTLTDPPFTLRAVASQNPTKCGFCDGWIKLYGLHPDQLDTLTFSKDGVPQAATSYYISSDSTITLPGMCAGLYTPFTVRTAGVCTKTLTTVVNLDDPEIDAIFATAIGTGCKADTLKTLNTSTPASDLTYTWDFGDGGTSTEINPTHVYTNTVGSYTVTLYATNTRCVDSLKLPVALNHFLNTDYSTTPPVFVCQTDPVNFTNLSTGTGADYKWYFADGTTLSSLDAVHTYTNMGTYQTVLVGHNETNGVHCYDTTIKSIVVDSNSILSLKVTDNVSAICKGQAVTMTAIYTTSGQLSNSWSMTDGFNMVDVNPILHSFEGVGPMTVNFNAKFRACPDKSASLNIHVFDVPSLYLGPDQKMCPGSAPISLKDDRNNTNPRAKWRWNTDATTAGILATKPGEYVATVTVDGCSTTDTVSIIKDCYVDVPNVFTPNGDGVNDYFFPRRMLSKGVVSFKMTIYNRWGQQVYEATSLEGQGWDGALNGVQQAEGVYVYIIDAEFKDGQIEQVKGNVTIMR